MAKRLQPRDYRVESDHMTCRDALAQILAEIAEEMART